ncbi:uncharacterized protein Hap1MRO34_025511 [Clarias gariepinus]
MQFTSRVTRNALWKAAKKSQFLRDNNLRFVEDLTAPDWERRKSLWPRVKEARDARKAAYYIGARAFIEGVEIILMESPAESVKKELPKRERNPPKKIKFYEPDPGSPKDDQKGHFVFLTFEDGYTAKIFNVTDILNKDDQPIACLRNLKPGEVVLARWSDNKFYSAKVNYVGTEAKKVDAKKGTKKDIKKRDTAAQRFYNRSSLPPAVQSTSAQQCLNSVEHGVTQEPATPSTPPPLPHYQPPATPSTPPSLPCYQPPATQSSPCLPRYQPPATQSSPCLPRYQPPATQSSPCLPRYQPPATQRSPSLPLYQPLATQSSPPLLPYYHLSGTPSEYQPFFIQPFQNYPLAPSSNHPQYPQHHTAQPVSFNQLQQMPVLTNSAEQWKPTTPSKLAAKESFLKMLYSPILVLSMRLLQYQNMENQV